MSQVLTITNSNKLTQSGGPVHHTVEAALGLIGITSLFSFCQSVCPLFMRQDKLLLYSEGIYPCLFSVFKCLRFLKVIHSNRLPRSTNLQSPFCGSFPLLNQPANYWVKYSKKYQLKNSSNRLLSLKKTLEELEEEPEYK